jgi:parallel beta-helix repeat protein/predicted outer membrane repeat protein
MYTHLSFLPLIILLTTTTALQANIIHVPGDSTTIQGGINGTSAGDTVMVSPGTYYEHGINFLGKAITVMGTDPEDSVTVASTIVDADSLGRGFFFSSGEDSTSVLAGLTITGGLAGYGAGIYCVNASPKIENCIITKNTANMFGGGIWCISDSSPIIRGCTISKNRVLDGPGGGIGFTLRSNPLISNCRIIGNRVLDEMGVGGGLYITESAAIIENCTIAQDTAGLSGGGIRIDHFDGEFRDCTITENVVLSWRGGGVVCYWGNPLFFNCTVTNNKAGIFGGGFYFNTSNPTIRNCLIAYNSTSSRGGGMVVYGSGTIKMRNCLFIGNESNDGGGLSLSSSPTAMINNCTFSMNTAYNIGGAIHTETTELTIINSILWGDSPDEIYGSPVVTYSDVEGAWEGTGNIDADPLFRAPEFGEYYLMSVVCGYPMDSPCIDAGHPDSVDVQLDCFHGLGTELCDMGAYGGRFGEPPVSIGEEGGIPNIISLPKAFNLYQNYPNPFNPSTTIAFDITGNAGMQQLVTLTIYDIRGRLVRKLVDQEKESGRYQVHWDGRDDVGQAVSSGIYLYTLKAGEERFTRKMTFLK